jgi:hypothetical protein
VQAQLVAEVPELAVVGGVHGGWMVDRDLGSGLWRSGRPLLATSPQLVMRWRMEAMRCPGLPDGRGWRSRRDDREINKGGGTMKWGGPCRLGLWELPFTSTIIYSYLLFSFLSLMFPLTICIYTIVVYVTQIRIYNIIILKYILLYV